MKNGNFSMESMDPPHPPESATVFSNNIIVLSGCFFSSFGCGWDLEKNGIPSRKKKEAIRVARCSV